MKDRFEYYKNISSIFKIVSIITLKYGKQKDRIIRELDVHG